MTKVSLTNIKDFMRDQCLIMSITLIISNNLPGVYNSVGNLLTLGSSGKSQRAPVVEVALGKNRSNLSGNGLSNKK